DIIKIAMVNIDQLLQPYRAHLMLQVHDELVFEIPPEELADLKPKIQQAMSQAVSLQVPLNVDIHVGQNWMDAKA
ncbi:MAG: DNA polymerase, partial [Prochlorotrichaceae cyanobacterium]